ncbi:hypothetical protein QBC43DRAFT_293254 [Cladorrhinum sp. PSN259]|nr:hypothetical protein QBC43DRAFT_293254 [Cladorrhinum sp. PSN259]
MLPKSLLFALVAALPTVTMAAAVPELPQDASEGGLKWTGKIFKTDTEPTVLHGEIGQVLEQILALNPDYVASEVNPEPEEDAVAALSKRAEILTCATMATGEGRDINAGADHLLSVGGNCETPAKSCRRMTCNHTTASYLCSEGNPISVKCNSLSRVVRRVRTDCCNGSPPGGGGSGRSGYIYNDRIWSVWVGYGNCNHATNSRPSGYPYPGGSPNGLCYN